MKDLVQVHNKGRWIRYSGENRFGHATFFGITSQTTPLKENMKCVWIEVSLFPPQSLPLTGYSNLHLITIAFCSLWIQTPCQPHWVAPWGRSPLGEKSRTCKSESI